MIRNRRKCLTTDKLDVGRSISAQGPAQRRAMPGLGIEHR